jgi:hypothetical protein
MESGRLCQNGAERPNHHGSRTLTIEQNDYQNASEHENHASLGVLHLQGARDPNAQPRTRRQHVEWTEDTVDNEGAGKKKSKSAFILQD